MKEKNVLMLFSGGKDSILSTCYLLEAGYKVYLVHYDNGASIDVEFENNKKLISSVELTANELIEKYGNENVKFLGTKFIAGIWRSFFLPYFNMSPNEISENYGQLPHSQFNCLTCRSSMYIYSIVLCKILNISNIAEGARISQEFVIELEIMLNRYRNLLLKYDIKLLLPVLNLNSDYERENLLLIREISSSRIEPQCLLGAPIDKNHPINENVISAVTKFYDKEIKPNIDELINNLIEKVPFQLQNDYQPHYLTKTKYLK